MLKTLVYTTLFVAGPCNVAPMSAHISTGYGGARGSGIQHRLSSRISVDREAATVQPEGSIRATDNEIQFGLRPVQPRGYAGVCSDGAGLSVGQRDRLVAESLVQLHRY